MVVSSFDVNWPARVNGLLASMQLFSPAFDSYLGIGCLANQQTVELVMVWRWLMPAMLGAACLVASPASLLIRWLLRKAPCRVIQKLGISLAFGTSSAFVLFFELYSLCTTTFITASISLLVCQEGPGEVPTVVAFPQLDCESPRYTDLLPGAIGATCVWAFLHLFLLCFAVKTVASSRKGSAGTGRG